MSIIITKKIESTSVKNELSRQVNAAKTRYDAAQNTLSTTKSRAEILAEARANATRIEGDARAQANSIRAAASKTKSEKAAQLRSKQAELTALNKQLAAKQSGLTVAKGLIKILKPRNQFDLKWKDRGSGAKVDLSTYRSKYLSYTRRLGSFAIPTYSSVNGKYSVMTLYNNSFIRWKYATGFKRVWKDSGSGASWDGSIWKPVPPSGYSYMGMVCVRGYGKPSKYDAVCVETKYTKLVNAEQLVWNDRGSGADRDVSLWYNKQLGTFWAHASHKKPGKVIRIFDVAKIEAEIRRRAKL